MCSCGVFANEVISIVGVKVFNDDNYIQLILSDDHCFTVSLDKEIDFGCINVGDEIELIELGNEKFNLIDVDSNTYLNNGYYFIPIEKKIKRVYDSSFLLDDNSCWQLVDKYEEITFEIGENVVLHSDLMHVEKSGELIRMVSLGAIEEKEIVQFHNFIADFNFEDGENGEGETGSVIHFKSGEVVVINTQNLQDGVSKSIYMACNEEGECIFLDMDLNLLGNGDYLFDVKVDKTIRRVVGFDGVNVIFDDGFSIYRGVKNSIIELRNIKCTNQVISKYPLSFESEIKMENYTIKSLIDCRNSFKLEINAFEDDENIIYFSLNGCESLKDLCGLGDFSIGDEVHFYPISTNFVELLKNYIDEDEDEDEDEEYVDILNYIFNFHDLHLIYNKGQ